MKTNRLEKELKKLAHARYKLLKKEGYYKNTLKEYCELSQLRLIRDYMVIQDGTYHLARKGDLAIHHIPSHILGYYRRGLLCAKDLVIYSVTKQGEIKTISVWEA